MKVFCLFTLLVALSAARVIEDVKEAPEQGLQGYFDTLKEIYYKLKELGKQRPNLSIPYGFKKIYNSISSESS